MSKENIAKSAIGVTLIMILGYALSFGKEAVVAYYFGITKDVDAYTIAIQIPVILFSFIAVAIQSVVVPLYSDLLYKEGKDKADSFVSNLWVLVVLLSLGFCVLSEICADALIYVFAPGFKQDVHELAVLLLRITLPTIFFSLTAKVYTAILNVHKKFVFPELSLLFLNIGLILSIIMLHARFGIVSACVGQIIGVIIQVLFLVIIVRKVYRPSFIFDIKDVNLKKAIRMSLPVFWSISVAEINTMVNRMVASFLFVGSIAALSYAQKINSVFIQFFTSAITTIVYPLYAESAAKGDTEQLNDRVNLTMSVYSLLLIPVMLYVLCYREEIVVLAFARGAFDDNAIEYTQQLLGIYVLGMLFFAIRPTINYVFYSLKDSITPAKNATFGVVLNIILNMTLPFIMGINGLALATALSGIIITFRLVQLLLWKYEIINLKVFCVNIKGILIGACVSLIAMLGNRSLICTQNVLTTLFIGFIVCITTYILVLWIFKVPIVNTLFSSLAKRFIKR